MTIKKVIQRSDIINMEIETPAYFKRDDRNYTAIYSETNIVEVNVGSNGFRIISKMCYDNMYRPEKINEGEPITAEQFNEVLSEAILEISGVEISKEVAA